MRVTVLAGGVGAARFLVGLVRTVDESGVCAVVNTADDIELWGLHVSPDLDTVTYTLAGAHDPERGWGLTGESWATKEALERYGGPTWFSLGDRDLATHLYRTHRLDEGATLTRVTAEIAAAWDLQLRILPMTDDPVRTKITVAGEGEIDFQEYFVRRGHSIPLTGVRFDGVDGARPAPDVIDAIGEADVVVIAPSNPIVSIGPLLAIAPLREAVAARRGATVAISPIVAGAAIRGPADRMLRELGHEPSVVGIGRLYADLARALVIDEADSDLAADVRSTGIECVVAPTVMVGPAEATALARVVLDAAERGT